MIFLDSTGVFSLICVLIQCGMAWIFAAFFAVLSAQRAPWLRSWSGAYLGMGLGLTALGVRFVHAHHHVAGETPWRDGRIEVRAFYGLYTGGKVLFAWCFLAGASRLRRARWPSGALPPAAAVLLGVVVGALAPTIEFILLFQVLWLPAVFVRVAWLLKPRAEDQPGWGWLVPRTLWLWSAVWIVYGIATVIAGPLTPKALLPWTYILRINSLIDLTFQAVLATGLIVVGSVGSSGHSALWRMPSRPRPSSELRTPDERPRPSAMWASSGPPARARAAASNGSAMRARLLAPTQSRRGGIAGISARPASPRRARATGARRR